MTIKQAAIMTITGHEKTKESIKLKNCYFKKGIRDHEKTT